MDQYKKSLIRWLVYVWTHDNPDKYLEILHIGSIRLAGGSDVVELLEYIREEMTIECYLKVTDEEVFDAIHSNNVLYETELSAFRQYCLENNRIDDCNTLQEGWFFKYDRQRRIKPLSEQYREYIYIGVI